MGRTTLSRTAKKASSHSHLPLKPYDARVLAALFTLGRRSHKPKVHRNSLGNYMRKFAKNRPEKHTEPKTWLVTKALGELEAEELVVKESASVLRLSEEVRLGVRKERHARMGDDSEEDERATQVYFRQISQDRSKARLSDAATTAESKKRIYQRKSEPKRATTKRPSANHKKKRRTATTNSGWKQTRMDSDSDLTELSDNSDDLDRNASLVRSKVLGRKGFAQTGSKSKNELLRLTKADLVEMIKGTQDNRPKVEDETEGDREDSVSLRKELDIVTSGFKELMEQKRRVLARLRRYEEIDEDAEDVQGEDDDMGGMGEMIFDNEWNDARASDGGYRQLDDAASDSETERNFTRKSSFATPELEATQLDNAAQSDGFDASYPQLPIVDGRESSPAPGIPAFKTVPRNQLKRRTHSWNSGHPLSPATSQSAADGNIFDEAESDGDAYEGDREYHQEPGPSRTITLPRTPDQSSSSPYKSSSSRQTAPPSDPFEGTSDANEEARLVAAAEIVRLEDSLRCLIEGHRIEIQDLQAQRRELTNDVHRTRLISATKPTIDFSTETGEDPDVERLRSELEQQVQTIADLSRNLEESRLNHEARYQEAKAELSIAVHKVSELENARVDVEGDLTRLREKFASLEQTLAERNETLKVVQAEQVEQLQAMIDSLTQKESEHEVAREAFEEASIVARSVWEQLGAAEVELERQKRSNNLISEQAKTYERIFGTISDQISNKAKALGMQVEAVTPMNLSANLDAITSERTCIEDSYYTLIDSINSSMPRDLVPEQDDNDNASEPRVIVGLRRIDARVKFVLKDIEDKRARLECIEQQLTDYQRYVEQSEEAKQILKDVCAPNSESGTIAASEKGVELLKVVEVAKEKLLRLKEKEKEMKALLVEKESALAEKARESYESQNDLRAYRRKSLTAYRALGRELEIEDGGLTRTETVRMEEA